MYEQTIEGRRKRLVLLEPHSFDRFYGFPESARAPATRRRRRQSSIRLVLGSQRGCRIGVHPLLPSHGQSLTLRRKATC